MSLQNFDSMKTSNTKDTDEVRLEDISDEVCRAIPVEVERKIKMHGEICDYLKNLYKTKNEDYGDSMHPLFEEYGLTAFLVLFGIKISRIKSLQYRKGNYESLEDSLLDLANYAMIAVTELRDMKNLDKNKNL